MKVLFIADIMGQAGREAVAKLLPALKTEEQVDLVIANGEMPPGYGLTPHIARDLFI